MCFDCCLLQHWNQIFELKIVAVIDLTGLSPRKGSELGVIKYTSSYMQSVDC